MSVLSLYEGLTLLVLFGISMISLVLFLKEKKQTSDSFLVADRDVSLLRGAFSSAVSWIWAPAIFICSLQSYENGLTGIFWFTLPNILCFFTFVPFAVYVRNKLPEGYTLPQLIKKRFNDKKTHLAFIFIFVSYQLGAFVINALAGGVLLNSISSTPLSLSLIHI